MARLCLRPRFALQRHAADGRAVGNSPTVNVTRLGLSPRGTVLARAAQDYGVYVVDRGGGGITFLAELGDPDIHWEQRDRDLTVIKNSLQWVTNNGPDRRGGGGTRGRRSPAPERRGRVSDLSETDSCGARRSAGGPSTRERQPRAPGGPPDQPARRAGRRASGP